MNLKNMTKKELENSLNQAHANMSLWKNLDVFAFNEYYNLARLISLELQKRVELINLTPHPVIILGDSNKIVRTIEPSGIIARLKTFIRDMGEIEGIKITRTCFDNVIGLPEEESGVYYIVSQMVKNSPTTVNRTDLLVPTEVVREGGKVLGCKSLGC